MKHAGAHKQQQKPQTERHDLNRIGGALDRRGLWRASNWPETAKGNPRQNVCVIGHWKSQMATIISVAAIGGEAPKLLFKRL